MPLDARPRRTVDDYLSRAPYEERVELLDGAFYVTPAPRREHQRATLRLARRLAEHVEAHALGEVFVAPFDVHLPTGDVVQPDVLFVAAHRLAIVPDWVRGAPDLVVEVVSEGSAERDRIVKRVIYERSGVPEYWIVDPAEGSIEVLRLEGGRYVPRGWFTGTAVLTSPSMPTLSVSLTAVFG